MSSALFDHFYRTGVIPVLEIDSVHHAKQLAEALLAGGLPIAEVTLRTDAALESIELIAREVPDIIVGAGTIITPGQARAAREAGAQFLVSPGLAEEVVTWAASNGVPIMPGAVTPTEMIRAIHFGLALVKFFPAQAMGGVKALKSLSALFPQLRFMPTGGIGLETLSDYLRLEQIHAVGGSWMATRRMIAEGKFAEIAHMAKDASQVVKQVRG